MNEENKLSKFMNEENKTYLSLKNKWGVSSELFIDSESQNVISRLSLVPIILWLRCRNHNVYGLVYIFHGMQMTDIDIIQKIFRQRKAILSTQ